MKWQTKTVPPESFNHPLEPGVGAISFQQNGSYAAQIAQVKCHQNSGSQEISPGAIDQDVEWPPQA